MNVVIRPSKKLDKKMDAVFPDGKVISFGAKGYSDYTLHKDPERRARYLARHASDPKSITTAGGLARDILWSKPSLSEAVKFAAKKHGVQIKLDGHLRR
jgi:hypothetical protein